MGGCDAGALALAEPPLKYHPWPAWGLTAVPARYPGQCLVVSLTGAVACKKVTQVSKGLLRAVGNRSSSVRAQGGFTVRLASRSVAKAGPSDPAVWRGTAVAQWIKGTLGITG